MMMSETIDESSPGAMIDTHCHLDDEAFASDLDAVLDASKEAGVCAWILIGYAPDLWEHVAAMAGRIPGMWHTLGVHPSRAQEWSAPVEARLRILLKETKAVAVGEFGLDFYRDNASFEVQREAVVGQLAVARDLGLPAIFHLRDAEFEMLEILESQPALPRMVFHSFDGSERLTDFILSHDAYVGVGGLATRQRSGELRQQLRRIPFSRIILETDSPYLVPARQKDRRNVPAQVRTIAQFLADFANISFGDVVRVTTMNAQDLFGRLLPCP
jgi:TatD DNase family protein